MYANMNTLLIYLIFMICHLWTTCTHKISTRSVSTTFFKSGYQWQSCIHGNPSEINDSVLYYMWQSWIELEHYSIAYFNRITMFEAL